MNRREVTLISAATVFGALASALAYRVLFSNPKKHFSRIDSSCNGDCSKKSTSQSHFDPSKRKGYLTWDDYFMSIAFLSAERSKDPHRQVGACLVSQDGVILGIGYNGFPRGCSDDKLPWAKKSKTGNPLETKYPYVCHAEVNAILNTNHASAVGQRLYVTMFPCNECAKIIIQSGVSEVIYFVEKRLNNSDTAYVASHQLLSMAGVKVRKHQPQMNQIVIKFEEP
ncbi:deoxycytidylate deaminase [Mangifera indica]|uniref:deoxycytidylate deaminase n=1 Tax=Mangifera indica TaxID=29780 RepID=UPI001CF94937|nr:deoxycytidylate deaminase [Mangifera indica]